MPERDISPVPDSARPKSSGHYQPDDDIELPPPPQPATTETSGSSSQTGASSKSSSLSRFLGSAVLMGAIAGGGLFLLQRKSAETQHANWQHVSAAAEASEGTSQLIHIDAAGTSQALPSIEVTAADVDRDATSQVRAALERSDVAAATAALQAAQRVPNAADPDIQQPEIAADSDLASDIKEGRKELFQIELFDCCDEDGDVVEILVNNAPFATVAIMHEGTLLSIPLAPGNNTVTVRSIHDGGGGVTLSFRTSRGDFFARDMYVGQEYQLGVTVK